MPRSKPSPLSKPWQSAPLKRKKSNSMLQAVCYFSESFWIFLIIYVVVVPSTSASGVAARRAARIANKRLAQASVQAPQETSPCPTEPVTRRYASHKRRPQEPYAVLTPRCAWKVSIIHIHIHILRIFRFAPAILMLLRV